MNIPNLPISPIVDKDGNPTDVELTFRQNLISALQQNAGPEGLVMPILTSDPVAMVNGLTASQKLTKIQNQQNSQGQFTCQLGTMLYVQVNAADYTQDKVVIAVRNTNDYPVSAPLFKTVTLT
jgi:hypothetical protein